MSITPEEIFELELSADAKAGLAILANDPDLTVLIARANMLEQDLATTSERIDRLANPAPIELTDAELMIVAKPVALQAATAAALEICGCLNQ
jgi:hypothetical protein